MYRVLQDEQRLLLLQAATSETRNNPVTQVISYIRDHLAEPISVADLAECAWPKEPRPASSSPPGAA